MSISGVMLEWKGATYGLFFFFFVNSYFFCINNSL
jgi:hypothetical protein